MKKKETLSTKDKCFNKAKEALNKFIKELESNGFSKGIRKYLNLEWQKADELFNNAVDGLKGVKFEVKKVKFVTLHMPEKIYRFVAEVNGKETNLFVRPLNEINKHIIVSFDGHYGVIPSKLMKFIIRDKEDDKDIIEEKINEVIKESLKKKKMKPIKFKHHNVIFAKDQKDYLPIPALKVKNKEGNVITCWKSNFIGRIRFLFTGKIWINISTQNHYLPPLNVSLNRKKDIFDHKDDYNNLFKRLLRKKVNARIK